MKRDMDLVRILLLKIEESDDPELMDLSVEGYTNNPKGRVPRALPVGE